MNLKFQIVLSDCLECPPGVSNYFYLARDERGGFWERNDKKAEMKYTDGYKNVEWFETVKQFLETDTFCNECAKEFLFAKKIPYQHWVFNIN